MWPCRLSFIDLLTMDYSCRPTCAMVSCVHSEVTQKLFCNQSIKAAALGCRLQSPFLLGDGRREIAISSTKICNQNLSLGTGEGGIKIRWKGPCSWTAKVNAYTFSPFNLLTNYKPVQVLEEEGLRNWLTYKVHIYSLWENHPVALLKGADNV